MTSVTVKSGIARHGRALVSIILFQFLLIIWLSLWAVEDYLNNQYVRSYVDGTLQAEGWVFGVVAFVGILGSAMGLVVRRRHGAKSLELEIPQSKASGPIGSSLKARVPVSASAALSSVHTASTVSTVASATPSVELHPAVAALKQELSEARMSLGLASVATAPDKPLSSSNRFDDNKPAAGTQTSPSIGSPVFGPRPTLSIVSRNPPPTVIRPGPSGMNNRPLPPTIIRPTGFSPTPGTVHSQPPPVPTIEHQTPPAPTQPVALLPKPEAAIGPQKDMSTVITGIIPAQKKKDEPGSSTGQNANGQYSSDSSKTS